MEGAPLPIQDVSVGSMECLESMSAEQMRQCYNLYESTIGQEWPLAEDVFRDRLLEEERSSVRCAFRLISYEGKVIGFSVGKYPAEVKDKSRGSLNLVIVEEKFRKRGLGRAMVESTLGEMRDAGVHDVQLGAGAGKYLWPGVPSDLGGSRSFFEGRGWDFTEDSIDMLGDISNLEIPEGVPSVYVKDNVEFVSPDERMADELLAFEQENFPSWLHYYEEAVREKSYPKVIVARTKEGQIIGTTLITRSGATWEDAIEGEVGTFGAIGVKENFRHQGVGIALVVEAIKTLKKYGVDKCFIGWTYLEDWYGTLGFKQWRKYDMSWLRLKD